MRRGIPVRNDLFAGPKNIDAGVDESTKIAQISLGWGPEFPAKPRIIRIVGWTYDEAIGAAPGANVGDHFRLEVGKSGDIAPHIVEQYAKYVYPYIVDLLNLRAQQLLS